MLIIEYSYNFLYVYSCMKLYDKKFLIYGKFMIRSFGQPGEPIQLDERGAIAEIKKSERGKSLKILLFSWNSLYLYQPG